LELDETFDLVDYKNLSAEHDKLLDLAYAVTKLWEAGDDGDAFAEAVENLQEYVRENHNAYRG
jgi:hypothetical protein